MHRCAVHVVAAFLLSGLFGCDDDPPPEECEDACETADETRCSVSADSIEVCQENAEGCLDWSETDSCGENQTCEMEGSEPGCVCDNECDAAGDIGCEDNAIAECIEDSDGCLYLDTTDCGTDTCVENDDGAVCESGGCSDRCPTEDETQCFGDMLQTCAMQEDGCLSWEDLMDCTEIDPPTTCDESGDTARCDVSCDDLCPSLGETQCGTGEWLQSCEMQENGCLDWEDTTDCAALDPPTTCDDAGDAAACAEVCTNLCEVEDETQCSDDVVQTCTLGDEGCLDWEDTTDCATLDPPTTCDDSADEAVCEILCDDLCDIEDETRCADDVVQTCAMQANGCLDWEDTTDCAARDELCEGEPGDASCVDPCGDVCDPDTDDRRCHDNWTQICWSYPDGCNIWTYEEDCSEYYGREGVCSDVGDYPSCFSPCTDECSAAGDTRCGMGQWLQTCELQYYGCLAWVDTTDCATQFCDDSSGSASCSDTCVDRCAADDTQCFGDVLQTCELQTSGCLDWTDTDCAGETPRAFCDATSDTVVCTSLGVGSCADPIVAPYFPFSMAGDDLESDFTNDIELTGTDCTALSYRPEVVFAVALLEGESIYGDVNGNGSYVSYFMETCGDAEACITTNTYTATSDTTVYFIVEKHYNDPYFNDYDIEIGYASDEVCDDSIDNDFDYDTDCFDSDCFGLGPCTTEIYCSDEGDNDDDGDVDCADSDCADSPHCVQAIGIWEYFEDEVVPDLEGYTITFTPDGADPMGYTWVATAGVTELTVTPGTGTTSSTVLADIFDDDRVWIELTNPFTLYGITGSDLFVFANGYTAFNAAFPIYDPGPSSLLFDLVVAPMWTDLSPGDSDSGPITVDEFDDMVVVSWENMQHYHATGDNTFQVIFNSDGSIDFVYVELPDSTHHDAVVGISAATPGGVVYPDATNFIP